MSPQKKEKYAYVRSEDAPLLSPPKSEVGIRGWLWKNIFASMADFKSVGSSVKSVSVAIITILLAYFCVSQLYAVLDFSIFSAVWSDPQGIKREACWTVEQGGQLPSGWHGACWPFVWAKQKFLLYGSYPIEEIWRVNLALGVGLIGLIYVLIENLPYRAMVGILLLTVYPIFSLVLLTGGNSDFETKTLFIGLVFGLSVISIGRLNGRGFFGSKIQEYSNILGLSGWLIVSYFALLAALSYDFGLEPIGTIDWGGLLITLVVAITGIVASLPIGILLALGRRSKMPVARIVCTVFIEFWRGVPLITVLFMASVMLPLFLPEGVNFDNLLRVLLGVMLFSAAYMAEVVRGGLQAIDNGQYEGAQAMGLSYWQTMRLVILPQALTHVIPGIVNTFIGLFKDTTLVSIVGIFDLLGAGQSALSDAAWSSPVQATSMYLYVGILFFIFCFGMSRYSIYMENKLSKSRSH